MDVHLKFVYCRYRRVSQIFILAPPPSPMPGAQYSSLVYMHTCVCYYMHCLSHVYMHTRVCYYMHVNSEIHGLVKEEIDCLLKYMYCCQNIQGKHDTSFSF